MSIKTTGCYISGRFTVDVSTLAHDIQFRIELRLILSNIDRLFHVSLRSLPKTQK
jgi:hypothetical protein